MSAGGSIAKDPGSGPAAPHGGGALPIAQTAFAVVGCALITLSLFVSWWTVNFAFPTSSGTRTGTLQFFPGTLARATVNGLSNSPSYASLGGSVASLYGNLQLAVVAIAVVVGLSAILSGVALTSTRHRAGVRALATWCNLAAAMGLVVLVALFPLLAPPALANGPNTFYGGCGTSSSPCSSFYGVVAAGGTSQSWWPSAGWYLAISALVSVGITASLGLSAMRAGWAASRGSARPPGAEA